MSARIYQPSKTAMSSGQAKTRKWVLEFSAETARRKDPLTGWHGIDETQTQVKLTFDTLGEAEAFAAAQGLAVRVEKPLQKRRATKAYADNFRHDRYGPWSH